MNKKILTEEDFNRYIDSQRIAFYVHDYLVRKKVKNEYVDIIGNTYCNYDNEEVISFYLAKCVLEDEYGVDMYSLPFRYADFKLKIQKYDLLMQLEKYLEDNSIEYKKEILFSNPKELENNDSNIEKLLKRIEDIDNKLICYNNEKNINI